MADNHVVLMGCGDIGPAQEPIASYSTLARSVLATSDIRFAQCERNYSDRGSRQVHDKAPLANRLQPKMAAIFSDFGFNVVSVASNHTLDFGEEALLDTIELFRKKGIQTIGGGRTLQEARQPAIVERNGVRVAFLGYCSVFPDGYAAGPSKAGAVPVRAHTYYEPIDLQAAPGLPPLVVTRPYDEDLAAMLEDIAKAKKEAHIVVVSIHWGVTHKPRMIADYQPIVAKTAFKAGADLILGHHAHVPQAIGVYEGKVCFYSLSSFVFRSQPKSIAKGEPDVRAMQYGVVLNPDNPQNSWRSLIAKAELSREGVKRVSFLPVLIDKQIRPEVLRPGDPRFDDAVNYMEWVSVEFDHRFTVQGDEVTVES